MEGFHPFKKSEKFFVVLTALFCVSLALTNVVSAKLFQVPFFSSIPLMTGDLTYPVTFLVTDIISEVWGMRRARFVILLGFFTNLFMFLVIQVALKATPHEYWWNISNSFGYATVRDYQVAYESVFSTTFHMVFSSMMAYLISQSLDIRTFHFLKKLTKGRHLWLRNNMSTITSQFVDSAVFSFLFWYIGLGLSFSQCVQIGMYSYLFKGLCALLDTPFCYMGVSLARKYFGNEKKIEAVT